MIDNRYIFNPETQEQRDEIARHAYIASKKRIKQISPIDRIIRATLTPSTSNVSDIEDTSKPRELLQKIREKISKRFN